jgi:hypothetical protein
VSPRHGWTPVGLGSALVFVLVTAMAAGCFHHPSQTRLPTEWDVVSADSGALAALVDRTRREGGPERLRAVLHAAADSTRPTLVRLHALSVIPSYLTPGREWRPMERLADTGRFPVHASTDHPDYTASTSIEPILRDSVRVAVLDLARSARDSMVRRAAGSLVRLIGPPLPERRDGVHCGAPADDEDLAGWFRSEAFRPLRSCPELLADLWRRSELDSTALSALYRGTQELRDARLPPVLSDVARDASRPLPVRWAALQAMATLAHPRMFAVSFRSLDTFGDRWCIHWGWHAHHAVQEEGAVPMGPEGRATVVRLLEDQARTNPDARLRSGARHLRQCALQLLKEHPSPAR